MPSLSAAARACSARKTWCGSSGVERGMLGLAFHPNFGSTRKFYVFYTDRVGHSQVYEYEVDATHPNRADPSTARNIITFEQPETSALHKAGQLQFGDDGYLYIAVGDGGGVGDLFDQDENPLAELGTIIRIDVDGGDPYSVPPDNPFADGQEGTS